MFCDENQTNKMKGLPIGESVCGFHSLPSMVTGEKKTGESNLTTCLPDKMSADH